MPIYEFICERCRNNFELLAIKKDDTVEIKCPNCGSENIERVMSKINISSSISDSTKNNHPRVENRACSSGTCSTITLPGHSR
jgi:putative FmdB family regulatory protein